MKGFAKRDYPASIFYQSPWYEKFKLVEDHFARVNTALTTGSPLTEIAVIHPLESYWLHCGELSKKIGKKLDKRFAEITEWLLTNGFDFDYICEATFPELTKESGYPLTVGEMQYKTVVVANCLSLRSSTLERLDAFQKAGGKLLFIGEIPKYVDGKTSDLPKELAKAATTVPFKEDSVTAALESNRLYGVYHNGRIDREYICQLRQDALGLWLFVSRIAENTVARTEKVGEKHLSVGIKGEWNASLWNTLNGEIAGMEASTENGFTYLSLDAYNQDSFLLRFDGKTAHPSKEMPCFSELAPMAQTVAYSLSEPNVLLLDSAYFALDNGAYSRKPMELLRLDNVCRKRCGIPPRNGRCCQPWATKKTKPEHTVKLKFVINSNTEVQTPYLAVEDAETAKVVLNGCVVAARPCGWYVDKAIGKIALPAIGKGKNVLEIALPFGQNTNVEWCYLLGDFGVKINGAKTTLEEMPQLLKFGDITRQSLPFYSGKLTYHVPFEGNGKNARVSVCDFAAAVLDIATTEEKTVAFAPYDAILPTVAGKTNLDVTAYISRQNAFGPVHWKKASRKLISPPCYYASRSNTTRRFVLSPAGVLSAPKIELQ